MLRDFARKKTDLSLFFVKKFKNNNSNQSWIFELTKKNGY